MESRWYGGARRAVPGRPAGGVLRCSRRTKQADLVSVWTMWEKQRNPCSHRKSSRVWTGDAHPRSPRRDGRPAVAYARWGGGTLLSTPHTGSLPCSEDANSVQEAQSRLPPLPGRASTGPVALTLGASKVWTRAQGIRACLSSGCRVLPAQEVCPRVICRDGGGVAVLGRVHASAEGFRNDPRRLPDRRPLTQACRLIRRIRSSTWSYSRRSWWSRLEIFCTA
jgi:hypothetical protein